ncbi:hypothetical protein QUB30_03110 [Microcoleus sp. BROC3]
MPHIWEFRSQSQLMSIAPLHLQILSNPIARDIFRDTAMPCP